MWLWQCSLSTRQKKEILAKKPRKNSTHCSDKYINNQVKRKKKGSRMELAINLSSFEKINYANITDCKVV